MAGCCKIGKRTEKPSIRRVAELVSELNQDRLGDSGYGPIGAVVGATYPEQLAELRSAMPASWILIPGFGAQGGGAADVAAGFDENGLGAVVNSSRHIIFAHNREDFRGRFDDAQWQGAVEAATREMNEQLAESRADLSGKSREKGVSAAPGALSETSSIRYVSRFNSAVSRRQPVLDVGSRAWLARCGGSQTIHGRHEVCLLPF